MRANHLELGTAALPEAAFHWPCRVLRVSEGALHVTVFVVPAVPSCPPESAAADAVPEPILVELRQRRWAELAPAAARGPLVLSLPRGCLLTLR
jgi:hypothetical protein